MSKLKICRGDQVEVIAGNDKGERGEVLNVIRKKNTDGTYDPNRVYVVVSGVRMSIKHQGRTQVSTQTGRIEREAPIHISNVMLIGSDDEPTRTGYTVSDSGEKTRVDRRTGTPLPKPTE